MRKASARTITRSFEIVVENTFELAADQFTAAALHRFFRTTDAKWSCSLQAKWVFLSGLLPAMLKPSSHRRVERYAKSRSDGLCVAAAACPSFGACRRRIFEQVKKDGLRLCLFERQVLRLHDRGQDARPLRLWDGRRPAHEGSAGRQ